MIPPFVLEDLAALDVRLEPQQVDRLSQFVDRLLSAPVNLTAVKQRDDAWRRLILDSLTLVAGLESLPPSTRVIDVGTGGGLPGVPLAIARPDLKFTLVDATGKKVRFLEQCLTPLNLDNVTPIQARAEDVGQDPHHRGRYHAAVSRAVGSVSEVLEYTIPLVEVGGRIMIIKGAAAEQELDAASDALALLGGGDVALIDGYAQGYDSELVIVSVVKDRPTPAEYPRRPGTPRASPL